MEDYLEEKQKQFNKAMNLYENKKVYQSFGKIISFLNVVIQIYLIFKLFSFDIGVLKNIESFGLAYFLADFINGLVHMYMDNNDNYNSMAGPLIASFHLHHKTPLYKKRNVFIVYYNESGSKIWLCVLQILFVILLNVLKVNSFVFYTFFYFSILSCIAELSHYSCHVSSSKFIEVFRKTGLILNKKHHGKHHMEDNVNYAFLNGISDPIINLIAKKYYKGYKKGTDLHYKFYTGAGTKNR